MRAAFFLVAPRQAKYSASAVAAALDKAGLDVHLVEGFGALPQLLERAARLYDRCALGVSFMTTMLADDDFLGDLLSSVSLAKRLGCLTVAGGPHASGDPAGTLLSLGFDAAVVGDGEPAAEALAEVLAGGAELEGVPNLAYLEGGRVRFTRRVRLEALDGYDPFPYWRGVLGPIEITRGCPHGCFYCQVSYMHGFEMRHRSPESVAKYAEIALEAGLRDLRFISPDSLAYGLRGPSRQPDLAALEGLLEALRKAAAKRGGRIFLGTFPSEVRPEHLTEESAKLLKRYVANREVIIGGQSGSDRVLKMVRRGHSAEDVVNAVRAAAEAGFVPSVDIIVGFPGEGEEDYEATLAMARRLVEMGARLHLHYYIPLPGTPLFPKRPSRVPRRVMRELLRLVGAGAAYGSILEQARLSSKILDLYERGVIYPRPGTAV